MLNKRWMDTIWGFDNSKDFGLWRRVVWHVPTKVSEEHCLLLRGFRVTSRPFKLSFFFLSISGLRSLTVCGSNPCNGKRLYFSPERVQTVSGAHPASSSRAPGCFPGVKQSERECRHVRVSSAALKNQWNFNSAPKCLLAVSRDILGYASWLPVQTKHLPTGVFSLRQELCTYSADQLRAPVD